MKVIYVDDEHSAHINFYFSLKEHTEIQSVQFFFTEEEALDYAKTNRVDCAFLDITLGGDRNGLALAQNLRTLQPNIEVVFVTGHDDFAREAYRVGGRGYLTKPYTQEELDGILAILQKLTCLHREEEIAQRPKHRVRMTTFGNFDLLVENRPVAFKNAKAKELLAYLVHLKGGTVSSAQVFLALWEHLEYTASTSTYVRRTVRALREELEPLGLVDIFICKRNCYNVDTTRFVCDYYDLMVGDREAADHYNGEYMNQYSWGESTIPLINRKANAISGRELLE